MDDQQFLCFFEPLLRKAAALTKIQMAIRATLFRKHLRQLPVELVIQRRAAFCIQEWWSNLKLKKRMQALANINKHVKRINAPDIYIEQTIYQNINKVVSEAHQGFRFAEQAVMFDFNPSTFGVALQVDESTKEVSRFGAVAVPKWMGVDLKPPDFIGTPYMNNLLGLFHFNQGDCQVLPVTYIVDYQRCVMDVDRNLLFMKIACNSVEEARRRALTLALLTYDMTRHIFVKLNTGPMLESPFDHQNIYEVQELYNL